MLPQRQGGGAAVIHEAASLRAPLQENRNSTVSDHPEPVEGTRRSKSYQALTSCFWGACRGACLKGPFDRLRGVGEYCESEQVGPEESVSGAYKDIDTVMASQAELTEIVHTLKQVVCVKG
ncbi:MAG: RtcB family protein [Deltaproteobacteria bacterium]|nr:RtcB family protein [Deltaproteobacteria bacterium]